MKEVEIREAQMVFVNLQSRWEVPANRDPKLNAGTGTRREPADCSVHE